MRPRLLEACPDEIKTGFIESYCGSQEIMFHLYQHYASGGMTEKFLIGSYLRNPQVCSNAVSAHFEILKWEELLSRCQELGVKLNDPIAILCAMESIFVDVFDEAGATMHNKWVKERKNWA